jgi:uncharacterized repeat protein (TIGR02543 family)
MKRFLYQAALLTLSVVMPVLMYAQQPFSGGNGTEQDPYRIATPSDLILMRDYCGSANTDKHFRLVNDITITTAWATPIGNGNTSDNNNSKFTGYFHGGGHKISELKINNRDIDYVGLFGYNEGTIDSLFIEGTTIKGGQYAGGLVGRNDGTIIACHVKLNVEASSASSDAFAGGLAGYNAGSIRSSSVVGDVSASGSTFVYSGGLIGYNSSTVAVSNCFAKGDVDAMAYHTGYAYSGGLTGGLNSGAVTYCYSTGTPSAISGTGIKYIGSFVGHNASGSISDCYYNNEGLGNMPAVGNENGAADGKSSEGMKTRDVYVGWDFNNVWGIDGDYPYLRNKPIRFNSIGISPYTLIPAFDTETFNYTADVANSVTSINITASATAGTVSGTGTQTLVTGMNQFPVTVEYHGGKLIDTITVHRTYTMNLNANGGAVTPSSVDITPDIKELPVPERAGYDFDEWNTKLLGDSISYTGETVRKASGIDMLYAQWTARKYTLYFNAKEGSTDILSKTVIYDNIIGELPEPVRAGYEFSGWNTLSDGTGNVYVKDTVYKAARDTVVYAQWTAVNYTLYLDINYTGGTSPAGQQVIYGAVVASLPAVVRPGYAFKEWNETKEGNGNTYTVPFIYGKYGDMTLYAQWTAKPYTVNFDTQCELDNPSPIQVTYGGSVGKLPTPSGTRAHYTFDGWNTKPDGTGETYADNATYQIEDDTTFFAKWKGDPYKLIFDYAGCSDKNVRYGDPVGTLTCNPVLAGHTFVWNTEPDGTGKIYDASTVYETAGNTTLHAVWTAKKYILTYNPKGGTVEPASRSVTYGEIVETLPKPSRPNYIFDGWNTKDDGTGSVYENGFTYNTDDDMTIYAQWKGEQYTLRFEVQNGSVNPTQKNVYYNTKVGALPEPVRSGYKFDGWFTALNGGGTKYSEETVYVQTVDLTLHPKWTAATYQVIFNGNGGSVPSPASKDVTYGIEIGDLSSISVTRSHYILDGWYTEPDGNGEQYTEHTIYKTVGNTPLYAKWKGEQYTISFDASPLTEHPQSITVYYGSPVGTLPSGIRPGYSVVWKDNNNNTIYTAETPVSGNATLTAEWTPVNYTLNFNAHGGSVNPTSKPVTFAKEVGPLPTPTRTGYTSGGWYSETEGNGTLYISTTLYMTAGSSTIYPKWTGNTYTLNFNPQGGNASPGFVTVTYGSPVGPLPSAGSRTYYTFKEWNTQTDGKGIKYEEATPYTINADNAWLYAIWTGETHTLSFIAEGGSVSPTSKDVNYSSPVGELPIPLKGGYSFGGWYTAPNGGGTEYTEALIYSETSGVTVYAKWESRTYKINFNNNYSSENLPLIIDNIVWNQPVTGNFPSLTREHYTPQGWNTASDGSGVDVEKGDTYQFYDDITLYAQWLGDPYNLTFNANFIGNAVILPDRQVRYGSPVGNLPAIHREGYILTKWNTLPNGGGTDYTPETAYFATANTELFAIWSPGTYILFFDPQKGEVAPTSKAVSYDAVVEELPEPVRTGYDFSGWYTMPNGGGTLYDASLKYTVAHNTSLYAQWTAKKYTLTFDANGGVSSEESRPVDYNSTLAALPFPSREGYTFDGWNTAKDASGTTYVNGQTYNELQDVTLYALWTAKDYTVTFGNNGGGLITPPYPITVTYDQPIGTLPAAERAGYDFKGWNTQADGSGASYHDADIYKTADNATLYAQWYGKFYTLGFDAQGGTVSPASQTVQYDSPAGELPFPVREGYTFSNWNGNQDGSGSIYTELTIFNKEQNITIYAQWIINSYTVNFEINYPAGVTPPSENADFDTYITLHSPTARTGYNFTGWNTEYNGSGTNYTAGNSYHVTGDATLYAQWDACHYEIDFEAGEGIDNPATISVIYDSPVGELPVPARTGYTFKGWFTGSGVKYDDYTNYETEGNTTLYAKWEINTYTLNFDMNYTGGVNLPSQSAQYGSTVILPAIDRTGYTYKWNTLANGTGTDYSINTAYTVTDNITFYAKWTANGYHLLFDVGKGSPVDGKAVIFDAEVGDLPLSTRIGYILKGWFTQTNGDGTEYTEETVYTTDGNTTLYALWGAIIYYIGFDVNYTGSGITIDNRPITYGATLGALPALAQRTGYKHTGWNTARGGDGTIYDEYSEYTTTGNTTLYAQWLAEKYTLAFDSQGGTAIGSREVTYDSPAGALDIPARSGYAFGGWFTGINGSGTRYTDITVYKETNSMTLYAKWTANPYTLNFDARGGAQVNSQQATYGTAVGTLPGTDRRGYTFGGWYTETNGDGIRYTETTVYGTAASMTLYAKWTINSFTISFDAQGGAPVAGLPANYDEVITGMPTPVRTGYTFGEWNTAKDGSGIAYGENSHYTVDGDIILYAQWKANDYTLDFDVQGGNPVGSRKVTYGVTINTLPNPTHTGYTFGGWFTEINGGGTAYAETTVYRTAGNTKLYALWTANSYTVNFRANYDGGINPASQSVAYNQTVTTLPAIARTGYTFKEWNASQDGGGNRYTATTVYTATGNTTLYAQWTVNRYTVKFDVNCDGCPNPSDINVRYDSVIGILPAPFRSGYTFGGWNIEKSGNGAAYTSTTHYAIAGDAVLYAQWTGNRYTLSFDVRGGAPVNDIQAVYGSPVGTLPLPSRANHDFGGWFTGVNGGGDEYIPATVYAILNNTILFAKWNATQYIIDFDPQGGSAASSLSVTYGAPVGTLPNSARTGYAFAGWNTARDGSGSACVETSDYTASGNTTLYAQWTPNEYLLEFETHGGDNTLLSRTVTYDSLVGKLPVTARTGYTFGGWFTGINGGGTEYTSATVYRTAGNTTLHARWTANRYMLSFNSNYENAGADPDGITLAYDSKTGAGGSLPVPLRTGHVFKEWNTAWDGSGTRYDESTVYAVAGNTTLYAQWTANTYILAFEANYTGEVVNPENPSPLNILYGAAVGTLPSPVRAGYIFAGWNTAENGSGAPYSPTTIYAVTGNTILYAQWTEISYSVNFTGNSVALDPQSVTHGAKIVRPSDPTLQGYAFAGWYKDNDLWDFNTPVTGDILLTAKWISRDTELKSLTVNAGQLAPDFRPAITDYAIAVPYDCATVSITGMPHNSNATVTGNVEDAVLKMGDNYFRIAVTAEDGVNRQTYTVLVTRADHIPSNEATLIYLTANGRQVTVAGNTLEYVAACGETSFALELQGSPYSNIAVDGAPYIQGQVIPLTGDLTTLRIHITSETGNAVTDYTLKANAAINENRLYYLRWPNVFGVNANPDNNGGYEITAVRWYRNDGSPAGSKGYIQLQNAASNYYAEIQSLQTEGWRRACGVPITRSTDKITAYPNPLPQGESLTLELPEQYIGGVLNIYDIKGALVKSKIPLPAKSNSINASDLNSGIYLFNISKDNSREAVKIIVE